MTVRQNLKNFEVTAKAGKLRLTRNFLARSEGKAARLMNRAITGHSGYKVGTPIEVVRITEKPMPENPAAHLAPVEEVA